MSEELVQNNTKNFADYTPEELKNVISKSKSYIEVINTLQLNKYYHVKIKEFVINNSIDISHFRRHAVIKPIDIKDVLKKVDRHFGSNRIKKYLLDNNIVTNNCSVCKILPEWNSMPLTLQLDHINGDHFDNTVSNLRLICPNCHSQTSNYTGRNKPGNLNKKCSECNKNLKSDNTTMKCQECIRKVSNICSVCNVKERYGTKNSKCKDCLKIKIEFKKCSICNEDILKQYNKLGYHKKCYKDTHKMVYT